MVVRQRVNQTSKVVQVSQSCEVKKKSWKITIKKTIYQHSVAMGEAGQTKGYKPHSSCNRVKPSQEAGGWLYNKVAAEYKFLSGRKMNASTR